MNIQLFDYELPKNLISQKPIVPRDHCKLLVYNKETKTIKHKKFYDIVDELDKNSVLVLNDTKVYPARLYGQKLTGGKIEIFLLGTTNNKFSLDNLSNS
jgi:S-adenosylmethionine:tRNA ribosyltransferase-isomerase